MSILFVLLMFLLILTISYFRTRKEVPAQAEVWAGPQAPRMEREYGFTIPQGYSFHPGHTWVLKEGNENTRIGMDSFAANLLGKVDQVEVIAPNRWIRQGQKFATVKSGGMTVELISPVEGVITAINHDVVQDPSLLTRKPFEDGWVASVKSPDFAFNQKNLVQGSMVAPWMQNNVTRLNEITAKLSPAFAQDGGVPVGGLLARVSPELRQKLLKEFFLN
ncbi:MAG TPA: glycine cleavage system protein H [Terriglobales bacterium]|nr:glycine cleavage system protein H [Terriglobales bacterium]